MLGWVPLEEKVNDQRRNRLRINQPAEALGACESSLRGGPIDVYPENEALTPD